MEKISKDTIITLDNNESYFVAATTYYNENSYHLLINVDKDTNYIIVKEINYNDETIVELIKNESELSALTPLFQESII